MCNLLQKIKLLPQVIQDLISEYNVEHRKLIKQLNEEYFTIIYKKCAICDSLSSKDIFWSIDYFIYKKCDLKCFWCSELCFNNDKNETLKQNYVKSVNDYLSTKTIQLPLQQMEI